MTSLTLEPYTVFSVSLIILATIMKRKIAVVTTSRADYSHLYWPLKDLAAQGHTVILITHRPPPRADRAARILALDEGRLSDPARLVVVP